MTDEDAVQFRLPSTLASINDSVLTIERRVASLKEAADAASARATAIYLEHVEGSLSPLPCTRDMPTELRAGSRWFQTEFFACPPSKILFREDVERYNDHLINRAPFFGPPRTPGEQLVLERDNAARLAWYDDWVARSRAKRAAVGYTKACEEADAAWEAWSAALFTLARARSHTFAGVAAKIRMVLSRSAGDADDLNALLTALADLERLAGLPPSERVSNDAAGDAAEQELPAEAAE